LARLAQRLNGMIERGELAIILRLDADESAATFQPTVITDTGLRGLILVAKLARGTP
jgi:hypothetical protein